MNSVSAAHLDRSHLVTGIASRRRPRRTARHPG
jgi:hypothetical protein